MVTVVIQGHSWEQVHLPIQILLNPSSSIRSVSAVITFFRRSSLSYILQVERLVKSLDEAYPEVAVIIETDLDLKKVLTLSRLINLNCFPILGLNRSWKRC